MEAKIELPEVDLFIIPLQLQEGQYLCQTDIELFPWAVLSSYSIEESVSNHTDTLPSVLRAYGPLTE